MGMSEVEVRAAVGGEVQRELKLVDCDVHAQPTPAMLTRYLIPRWARHLERYGRRAPMVTEWYPRARNGGMRIDAWPTPSWASSTGRVERRCCARTRSRSTRCADSGARLHLYRPRAGHQ
jgi:hypothetical protein